MPKISVNGLKFHYWQMGQGPDMVMIHGLGGNLAVWHLTMVSELQSDFRIMTYDLRGHGRSDAPESGYTTEVMAQDLLGIMDALEIERAHLVGHCLGGDVALHFALHYPHRTGSIVAIEAMLPSMAHVYRDEDWVGWSQMKKALETATGKPVPPEKLRDVEWVLKQILDIPIVYGPAKGRPRGREQIMRMLDAVKVAKERDRDIGSDLTPENLVKIPSRALLIYDANSIFMKSHDVLRAHLPNCGSVLLPESRLKHFLTLEHPDLILQHIKAFLKPNETQRG